MLFAWLVAAGGGAVDVGPLKLVAPLGRESGEASVQGGEGLELRGGDGAPGYGEEVDVAGGGLEIASDK